jgi:glycosyltransferase involved in cell wall biosynthesis
VSRPIVTVVYSEATAPVVRSQTPPLLRAWRAAGRRVDAAYFTTPRALFVPGTRLAHRQAIAAVADAIGREPWRRTHLPRDVGLVGLGSSLAAALRERGDDDPILFCRQPRAALVGIAARERLEKQGRRATVLLDLRGLRDEEWLMTIGRAEADCDKEQRARLETYRSQEREACRGADGVLCVSKPMIRQVAQRHGLADAKLGLAPNHTGEIRWKEEFRDAARKELRVAEGTLLVVWSGTMAAWQKPEESALLVKAMQERRPDARLLFLTPDTSAAKAAVAKAGLENALHRAAKTADVVQWLSAADYGLLLRDESLVNRAASPVKFGEYLACGVRPVLTPGVGDQSDACVTHRLGLVVGLADVKGAARRIADDAAQPGTIDAAARASRRAWAAEHISPERIAARIAEFADRIVTGK